MSQLHAKCYFSTPEALKKPPSINDFVLRFITSSPVNVSHFLTVDNDKNSDQKVNMHIYLPPPFMNLSIYFQFPAIESCVYGAEIQMTKSDV